MKIGYPCINRTLECRGNRTFRLQSYSEKRLVETVENNLDCLAAILEFNRRRGLLFFRITSDLVPFASHPVCTLPWQRRFREKLGEIGASVRKCGMRISMHPDQFTLINSPDEAIFERSVRELSYHAAILDLMELDRTAKIQIHAGGVYGDREKSLRRFARRHAKLDAALRRRLVVENDDRCYTLRDCLRLHDETGIPVLFDVFHHIVKGSGEPIREAVAAAGGTWKKTDGLPMLDYSTQRPGERRGVHADSIDLGDFRRFLAETRPCDFDLMLEIKEKERSALKALKAAAGDGRLVR
jgi:UV DNA damage endonuclease